MRRSICCQHEDDKYRANFLYAEVQCEFYQAQISFRVEKQGLTQEYYLLT